MIHAENGCVNAEGMSVDLLVEMCGVVQTVSTLAFRNKQLGDEFVKGLLVKLLTEAILEGKRRAHSEADENEVGNNG